MINRGRYITRYSTYLSVRFRKYSLSMNHVYTYIHIYAICMAYLLHNDIAKIILSINLPGCRKILWCSMRCFEYNRAFTYYYSYTHRTHVNYFRWVEEVFFLLHIYYRNKSIRTCRFRLYDLRAYLYIIIVLFSALCWALFE